MQITGQSFSSKVNIRHLADGWVDVEVVLRLETEYAGDDAARKSFTFISIVPHVSIEEPACGLDAVLRIYQLLLQLKKLLVRFQPGIVFNNGKKPFQGLDQLDR